MQTTITPLASPAPRSAWEQIHAAVQHYVIAPCVVAQQILFSWRQHSANCWD